MYELSAVAYNTNTSSRL